MDIDVRLDISNLTSMVMDVTQGLRVHFMCIDVKYKYLKHGALPVEEDLKSMLMSYIKA